MKKKNNNNNNKNDFFSCKYFDKNINDFKLHKT